MIGPPLHPDTDTDCMNDSFHGHIRTPLPPVLLPKKYTFINHVCLHTCYKKEHRDISVCEATCRLANAYYSRLTARHTKLRELAQLEAHAQLGRMETLRPECRGNWGSSDVHYNCVRANAICRAPQLLNRSRHQTDELMINNYTVDEKYRYYSIINCTSAGVRLAGVLAQFCLIAKRNVQSPGHVHAVSDDGLRFWHPRGQKAVLARGVPMMAHMAHNLAVLRLGVADYLLVGGLQDWGLGPKAKLPPFDSWHGLPAPREDPKSGVLLWRTQWPPTLSNRSRSWNWWPAEPEVIIHGSNPRGCIDRRPAYTGNAGCEFDGRLSLVRLHRAAARDASLGDLTNGQPFRLYARANLHQHEPVGGRAVQTTMSHNLRTWSPWEPVTIKGLPAETVDIYFFLVQANPVKRGSLLALFPVSQPPNACVAMAFSSNRDGVNFSQPVNLVSAKLGWRTADERGRGPIEYRATAHPVAGVFVRGDDVFLYLHFGVLGTDMEQQDTPTKVERYVMSREELVRLSGP